MSSGPKGLALWLRFGVITLITLFFLLLILPIPTTWPAGAWLNSFYPHLGLDLQGGTHLVYEADTSQLGESEKGAAVEGVRDVIERRVNAYGVTEPLVQATRSGNSHRVIVELAGVTDVKEAIKLIGETPLLQFKEQDETAPPIAAASTSEIDSYNTAQLAKAEATLKELKAGADFATLAKERSEDSSAKDGGDLGAVTRGLFVPDFDTVVFTKLADGQLYDQVLKTAFGYHLVQRVSSENNERGELLVKSRHILYKTKTVDSNNEINWKTTELTGKQLERSQVIFDPQTGVPSIELKFNSDGDKLFEEITGRNINKPVGIFLDEQLISAPTVQTKISGGTAIITGNFDLKEAKLLAQRLNAGALPVSINLISQETIGASLGKLALQRSLIGGIIGLLVVALFMILFYRLPGLIAVIALLIYSLINAGLYEMIPVTLTLAGIAGFILSIGMAVDANVLIFERVKDELRKGESLNTAIEHGFDRAWLSIRDSNVSSLITTFILFWFGSSIIKGFALTLGLGILISMFTAIFVSRNLLLLVTSRGKFQNKLWLFGGSTKK